MKKLVFLFAPVFMLVTLDSCSTKTFKSTFRTKPVVADGKLDDWGYAIEDENVDRSGRVKYAIANDKENLYVTFRVFDKTTQAKIFLGGMKLVLDTAAEKKPSTVIEFPLFVKLKPGEKPKWDFKPGERLGVKDLHLRAKENHKEMILSGFYAFANGKQALNNNVSNVSVGFDWDEDDALIYEAVIPFKAFYSSAFKKGKQELSIGVRVQGIDKNILPEQNFYAMMNGMGRRNGGRSNTASPNNLPNPAENAYEIYTEPIKYDLKLQLATR
ncbi:hypothetical protein NF867_06950 [Solitalea sp. MAHUQ-68]|uniref:Uncharacterized protein n=1 Tax=Solitalea agri TaxID=2953739 RepID=A0A9X2F645_9SPHI|nr:hypothetical protein [Solitalea agri]MCO4292593.1 hypothetical protein [Solitalea agri]